MRLWDALLGLGDEAARLTPLQMVARVVLVYAITLLIVRLGKKRFMGRGTAFDVIVGIIIGSIASRAITGNAPLAPSLAAIAALMALHWGFSALALHWHSFGVAVKGRSRVLVRDGEIDEAALRREHLTRRDFEEDLREKGHSDVRTIAEARLERDGTLSLCPRGEPKVVEVAIADGVQRVRIELG